MKKLIIPMLILILFLMAILSFTISSKSNYVRIPEYTSSYTKAICTNENFCQDYQFFCRNSEVIAKTPITGAAVQFSSTWQDPRSSEIKNKFC